MVKIVAKGQIYEIDEKQFELLNEFSESMKELIIEKGFSDISEFEEHESVRKIVRAFRDNSTEVFGEIALVHNIEEVVNSLHLQGMYQIELNVGLFVKAFNSFVQLNNKLVDLYLDNFDVYKEATPHIYKLSEGVIEI